MESGDGHRCGLLKAGGILSVIAGAFEVIGGGALVASVLVPDVQHALMQPAPFTIDPPFWRVMPSWLIGVGVPLLVLGAIAMAGGVSATRRKTFRLSLAGAICALPSATFGLYLAGAIPALSRATSELHLGGAIFCSLPSVILGILAIIFVATERKEFSRGGEESGT